MANPKHVKILNQGVDVWNKWREDNYNLLWESRKEVDLEKSAIMDLENFIDVDLSGAHFSDVDLDRANLSNVNLSGAYFTNAEFFGVDLSNSDLRGAKFTLVRFQNVNFNNADLNHALFALCDISVSLIQNTTLIDTDFTSASFDNTAFADCDLSRAKGLEQTYHFSKSTIGIDTIYKSGGKIPETFLRGCGVPDIFITYARSLVDNPIEYYSCFISFTEKDDAFSEHLYNDMQAKGVRCWRWKEDAKWGRTLRKEIDEAVRDYDKLVVICSKDSLNAPAVLEEIERALDKEDDLKRKGDEGEVLFPIRIDDYIFNGWESELKIRLMKKNIGDFSDWSGDPEKYRKSVERLVRDLNRRSAVR